MDLDDVFDPKVAVAVAVTAAVTSPPVRKAVRQGAVYGLAGLLIAGDRLSAITQSVAENAQEAARSTKQAAEEIVGDRQEPEAARAASSG